MTTEASWVMKEPVERAGSALHTKQSTTPKVRAPILSASVKLGRCQEGHQYAMDHIKVNLKILTASSPSREIPPYDTFSGPEISDSQAIEPCMNRKTIF